MLETCIKLNRRGPLRSHYWSWLVKRCEIRWLISKTCQVSLIVLFLPTTSCYRSLRMSMTDEEFFAVSTRSFNLMFCRHRQNDYCPSIAGSSGFRPTCSTMCTLGWGKSGTTRSRRLSSSCGGLSKATLLSLCDAPCSYRMLHHLAAGSDGNCY